MKMSKNVIVLLSIGGVALVGAVVLAVMALGAMGERTTANEDLESVRESVSRLNQNRVKPWDETLKLVEANTALVDGWQRLNYARAGEGDAAFDGTLTGAAFKQQLLADMAGLQALTNRDGTAVVSTSFSQTFRTFIEEGSIPSADELAQLQRHWYDLCFLAATLASNGVIEVTKADPTTKATAKALTPVDEATQKRQEKAKKKKKKAGQAVPEETGPVQIAETYQVDFKARPAGVVNALNALTASKRFVTVKGFGFFRESDMIVKAIGSKNEKKEKSAEGAKPKRRGGRISRLAKGEEQPAAETVEKKGIVNDPDREAPFKVSVTVEINDFGTAAAAAEPAAEATDAEDDGEETEVEE